MQTYRSTFALWMRGLFKEHYGFSPEQATWCTSDPEIDGYTVGKNVTVEMREGKTALQKLKDGEVWVQFCNYYPGHEERDEKP